MNENLREAAQMLMYSSTYSMDVIQKMRQAYLDGDYKKVMEISASLDVPEREELDSKITQVRNPRYEKINGNVRENAALDARQEDGEKVKIAPYLFRIEGVDGLFDSAALAVVAYKEKDQGKQTSKHSFKSNHIPNAHKQGGCKDEDSAAIEINLEEENE